MQNNTMMQYFHWYYPADGSLWNHLKENATKLSSLGITAVWLPPACKASVGGLSVGYDIYDLYDLGEFDQKSSVRTKYGTKEDYLVAIKLLQEKGINVYVDIVLNHLAGGDEKELIKVRKVQEDNRLEFDSDAYDIEAFTKFTYPGRAKKYSDFEWTHTCFSGVDYDDIKQETAIYKIVNDHAEMWDEMITEEKGNYDYLMYNDIEFRNGAVVEELKKWGIWYHETTRFSGMRLDAVKHISPHFYNSWIDYMRAETGKELFCVGEYWAPGDLPLLLKYIEASEGRMSLFDSALQHNLHTASNAGKEYDLTSIFSDTLVGAQPLLAVTLTDNHDTQPLQALEAPIAQWFKPIAYALILLRQDGYPCVFFPDLFGSIYTDKGSDGEDHEIHMPVVDDLEKLLNCRKNFAYGEQKDYFDNANCIGWTRAGSEGVEKSSCAVLISNSDAATKSMEIGKHLAGRTFYDLMQNQEGKITIDENGKADFTVGAGSVAVWVLEDL